MMTERVIGRRRFVGGATLALLATGTRGTEKEAYMELGDQFEDREKHVLGESGFEGAVKEVAKLEAALSIHDLARFTP